MCVKSCEKQWNGIYFDASQRSETQLVCFIHAHVLIIVHVYTRFRLTRWPNAGQNISWNSWNKIHRLSFSCHIVVLCGGHSSRRRPSIYAIMPEIFPSPSPFSLKNRNLSSTKLRQYISFIVRSGLKMARIDSVTKKLRRHNLYACMNL